MIITIVAGLFSYFPRIFPSVFKGETRFTHLVGALLRKSLSHNPRAVERHSWRQNLRLSCLSDLRVK
jgi:hypothetical protein